MRLLLRVFKWILNVDNNFLRYKLEFFANNAVHWVFHSHAMQAHHASSQWIECSMNMIVDGMILIIMISIKCFYSHTHTCTWWSKNGAIQWSNSHSLACWLVLQIWCNFIKFVSNCRLIMKQWASNWIRQIRKNVWWFCPIRVKVKVHGIACFYVQKHS